MGKILYILQTTFESLLIDFENVEFLSEIESNFKSIIDDTR